LRQGLIDSVIDIAKQEEEAAIKVYPLFNSTHEGYAVILEEFEEALEEIERLDSYVDELWHNVRYNFFNKKGTCEEVAVNNIRLINSTAIDLACEAIQIAAMANKFIESIKPDKIINPDKVIDPRD
jgi:hypothetical protein